MAINKITDQIVRAMDTPDKGKQNIIRDSLLVGFGVRKTATGCTAFIFQYVVNGRERRITIGQFPGWSVAAAREQAKLLRRQADIGEDPLEKRMTSAKELTLKELWEQYQCDILPKKSAGSQRNERSMWARLVLPQLGNWKLSAVKRINIERLHTRISVSTPAQANRCLASISHVFTKAMEWGLIVENPASSIKKNNEEGRERYLSDEERARFVAMLDKRGNATSALALKFLLLTGARSGEVFKATWDQFDLDNGVWTKPSAHTKQRRPHRVPLSEEAVKVLRKIGEPERGRIVFAGRKGNSITTMKTLFRNVCVEAEILDFRVHDLRHTFASLLVDDGTSLPIIGKLLGHTQAATTNRYAHLADAPLRVATNRLAFKVKSDGKT